jgi:hypothetical protein
MGGKEEHLNLTTPNRKETQCNTWEEEKENTGPRERDRRLCLAGKSIVHTELPA